MVSARKAGALREAETTATVLPSAFERSGGSSERLYGDWYRRERDPGKPIELPRVGGQAFLRSRNEDGAVVRQKGSPLQQDRLVYANY